MKKEGFLRNLVFGVEDGLVSTLGYVSGIASVDIGSPVLLLSGIVLIFVEAFSMAVGSYLTTESIGDLSPRKKSSFLSSFFGSIVMFLAYIGAGTLVIAPYAFSKLSSALPWSAGLSLVALFLLGIFSARVAGVPPIRRGLRMVIVGGGAIGLGIFVARTVLTSL